MDAKCVFVSWRHDVQLNLRVVVISIQMILEVKVLIECSHTVFNLQDVARELPEAGVDDDVDIQVIHDFELE